MLPGAVAPSTGVVTASHCPRAVPRSHSSVRLVRSRVASLLLGGAFVAVAAACDQSDPFRGVATSENVVTGLGMAALSTGTAAPTALDLLSRTAVRPVIDGTGAANFQLALDVDGQGRVQLIPVLALLNPPAASVSVGLARSDVAFELLERAPTGGFVNDSTVSAEVGETWVVRLQAGLCSFGDPLYAKLVVDGINQQTRRLAVRFLLNANCGYRDLTEGVPRN